MVSKDLTEAINRIDTIEQSLDVQRKNLSDILTSKGNPSQATEKLSVLINRVNEVETGVKNEIPQILELKQVEGSIKKDTFKISWKIQDKETPHMVKQYLMLNGEKRDITNVVGFDKELYEYQIEGLQPNTSYNIQIIAFDGFEEGSSEIIPMSTTNNIPVFSNITSEIDLDSISFNYHVEDKEYPIEKHYIKVDGIEKDISHSNPNAKDFSYKLEGLERNTSYAIQFVVEIRELKFESEVQNIKTLEPIVYGVRVMENNNNSETSVTYIGDSVGFIPRKYGNDNGWLNRQIFKKIKQCGFKQGKVFKYISPKDEARYIDGTLVGEDVDIMTEFPKIYWKFTQIENGYEIRISDAKVDKDFICPRHTIGTKEVDNIYIGCYEGCNIGERLRSIKGKYPLINKTYIQFRNLARANGKGYQQFCYYPNVMLQILYLIMYKSRDSQSALGMGYTNNNSSKRNTGSLLTNGLLYGESTGKQSVKFLGIEDWYGNVNDWMDGLCTLNNNLLISKQDIFNDTGEGYENCGRSYLTNVGGYLNKIRAGNKTSFIPKEVGGSETTDYCDYTYCYENCISCFGGHRTCGTNGLDAGAFFINISDHISSTYDSIGGRLVYLGY